MEKRPRAGFGVLCMLCAAAMASSLPRPAGAAHPTTWHPNPAQQQNGKDSYPGAIHGAPARHRASLPPLSAPPPTAGADLPPSIPPSHAPEQPAPHFGFPLQPTFGFAAPPVGPSGGEGYPFIGSNPTVPLPTGMTDTATVLPLPDTGDAAGNKVVGLAAAVPVQFSMIGLVVVFTVLLLTT
ncbi:hypothetical protein ACP70R_039039 [Stipagrostis hirtigluma subsp. patula]